MQDQHQQQTFRKKLRPRRKKIGSGAAQRHKSQQENKTEVKEP
jgi:hypothetical protein